jgi:hypothetical protein
MGIELLIALILSLFIERDLNSTISGFFYSLGTSIFLMIRPLTFNHTKYAMLQLTLKEFEERIKACNTLDIQPVR